MEQKKTPNAYLSFLEYCLKMGLDDGHGGGEMELRKGRAGLRNGSPQELYPKSSVGCGNKTAFCIFKNRRINSPFFACFRIIHPPLTGGSLWKWH